MVEGWTGGASDIVKAESSGEDPRALSQSKKSHHQGMLRVLFGVFVFFFGAYGAEGGFTPTSEVLIKSLAQP